VAVIKVNEAVRNRAPFHFTPAMFKA
jgi:hypothetical protein